MSENMEGNFEGIGVEFLIQQDTLMVVAAILEGLPTRQASAPATALWRSRARPFQALSLTTAGS